MWVRSLGWEDPLRRKRQLTPVFLPGESHGQRSLVGYKFMGSQSRTRLKPLSILSMLDCACSLAKILYKLASPPASLEQFLRATEKLFPGLYTPQ